MILLNGGSGTAMVMRKSGSTYIQTNLLINKAMKANTPYCLTIEVGSSENIKLA
jgi:hypothetical protein